MPRIYKRTISVLLICLTTLLIVNNAVYTHVHVMPDGSLVTHAHPFQKGDDSGQGTRHSHSNAVYFLLDHIQILFLLLAAILVLFRPEESHRLVRDRKSSLHSPLILLRFGRAPPHCM